MTDQEIISRSLGALGAEGGELYLVKKGGRVLLALPREKEAALMALRLYQPQRLIAKVFVQAVTLSVRLGLQKVVLKRISLENEAVRESEGMPKIGLKTAGVLLGNPDHLVRRAIVSFRTGNGFEVAKVAFGGDGVVLIEGEAKTIQSLPSHVNGIPRVLGTHHRREVGVMRMPYVKGEFLSPSDTQTYVTLLSDWLLDEPVCRLEDFPEWGRIAEALSSQVQGEAVLETLRGLELKPAIRHGDFAPWNLVQDESGSVLALDWEWGTARGVSGFDLIHYLTQELSLVRRLEPSEVVNAVEATLKEEPFLSYLQRAGWGSSHRELFIAAIAFTLDLGLPGSEVMLEKLQE